MDTRVVNIAYVGNGKSANRYHIPYVLARSGRFSIKKIFDRHVSHDMWDAVPGVEYVENIDEILDDPQIDVVEICSPSKFHFELAKEVLRAKKHVTVDKPFAATEEEAAALFTLAAEQGVTAQCYQNRRFDSDFVTAKRVVESGKLGHVFEIVTSYDYFRPHMMDAMGFDRVDNAAYGHASHCLDQLISWLGVPDTFHAETRQLNGEGKAVDYFDLDLYYRDRNLKATAHANYQSAFQRPSFEIYGDRGAYIKWEKDQQERDLKHFYLPAGHDDFGIDSPDQYGTLRFLDDEGVLREERVPTCRTTYSSFYDALYETVIDGAPQLVAPDETLAQMKILEASIEGKH